MYIYTKGETISLRVNVFTYMYLRTRYVPTVSTFEFGNITSAEGMMFYVRTFWSLVWRKGLLKWQTSIDISLQLLKFVCPEAVARRYAEISEKGIF